MFRMTLKVGSENLDKVLATIGMQYVVRLTTRQKGDTSIVANVPDAKMSILTSLAGIGVSARVVRIDDTDARVREARAKAGRASGEARRRKRSQATSTEECVSSQHTVTDSVPQDIVGFVRGLQEEHTRGGSRRRCLTLKRTGANDQDRDHIMRLHGFMSATFGDRVMDGWRVWVRASPGLQKLMTVLWDAGEPTLTKDQAEPYQLLRKADAWVEVHDPAGMKKVIAEAVKAGFLKRDGRGGLAVPGLCTSSTGVHDQANQAETTVCEPG